MMKRNPKFTLREVAGTKFLMPTEGSWDFDRVITLNDLGLEIYQRIEEVSGVEDLVDQLFTQFDAPRDVIAADVRDFLAQLIQEGILTNED